MTQDVRSPLKWVGGKSASAERIVAAFPHYSRYDTYIEPCCGAAHVLMAKEPYGHDEIYNDLDENLFIFWREVQSNAPAMADYLDGLLYSRKLYYEFYRSLFDGTPLTSFQRATRWFYVLRSTGTGWIRKSPVGWDHRVSNIHAYRSAIELFPLVLDRIRYVAVDNRDVLVTIKRYDDARAFFYIDPPYFGAERYYEPSKKGFPHAEMAALLSQVKGMVALSYYPDARLLEWYPTTRWRRITWEVKKSSQIQIPERGDIATEMLLCNYNLEPDLWGSIEEEREVA